MDNTEGSRLICDKCSELIRTIFHEQGGLEKLKGLVMLKSELSVKIKDTNEKGTEWFWINNPRFISGNIVGTVNNELIYLDHKIGDIVSVNVASIQNFCYIEDNCRISFLPLDVSHMKELIHKEHSNDN